MDRTYDEILEDLEDRAEDKLVVSTARRTRDEVGSDVYLALVTVDGVTRGVVTRTSALEALNLAAERVLTEEDEYEDFSDEVEDDSDEGLFDRAVGALETAVGLLRRVRR